MDNTICYLTTDLELKSPHDLTALAAVFEAAGVYGASNVVHSEDGWWHANLSTNEQYDEPEHTIAAMLAIIESLNGPRLADWNACTHREFNIGYDC